MVPTDLKAWRLHFMFLSLILVASIGVRAGAWRLRHTGAIEQEGAEYARIAENLRNGLGYVGIATPGTELTFPPLFPLLIAAASLVTHDYELAGRLVSFLLGVLLPLPVFGVAVRLFQRRTAIIAAIITILHPLFINLSITVFSEGPYATLLLSGVYLALRAFDRPSVKRWSLVGWAFGAAYLLRQEALVPLLVAVLFALTAGDAGRVVKIKRGVAAMVVFAVLALPQVILLYRSTGELRLEGKSAIVFAVGIRTLAEQARSGDREQLDKAVNKAWFSIDDNLEGTGVAMRSNADVIRETRVRIRDLIRFGREAMRRNTPTLISQFSERWLGAPFLPALAFLGAFRRPWRRSTALSHMFFMLIPATAVMATCSKVPPIYARYYFILVPFLVIWGANGLVEIARWTNASLAAGFRRTKPWVPGAVVSGLIAVAMLSCALTGTRGLGVFAEGSARTQATKDAGAWIQRQQTGRVRIMDSSAPLAFHANADLVHFPYCSAELALRFADAAKVDYIVLRPGVKDRGQYYEDWLVHGIPNPRAELVYVSSGTNPPQFMVFRWHRNDGDLYKR